MRRLTTTVAATDDGRRPTLIGPGATITDRYGRGVVVRVLPDRCVVRYPLTGMARLAKYWELDATDVAPDPAHLPADAGHARRGARPCDR